MADNRIYNFSAGPSMLPVPVLERCAADMLNYQGSGMSVMEMSHRSKVYDGIIKEMRSLRDLTQHLTTRADDNHAPPVSPVPKERSGYGSVRRMSRLGKVLRVASN